MKFLSIGLFLFQASSAFAGEFMPRDLGRLTADSTYVVLAKVEKVKEMSSGMHQEIKLRVQSVLKGELKQSELVVPLNVQGIKGFDFKMEEGQIGTFFLKSIQDNQAVLTHPGSIALFHDRYFK